MALSLYKRKDFKVVGRRTGCRLRGRENEYVYEIFWNGKQLGDHRFSSKRAAGEWISKFIAKGNKIVKAYNAKLEKGETE